MNSADNSIEGEKGEKPVPCTSHVRRRRENEERRKGAEKKCQRATPPGTYEREFDALIPSRLLPISTQQLLKI